jgi:hypothetical protein
MKKSTANHSHKGRNTTARNAAKKNNSMYANGKKIANRIMNILNYQYNESDLQFVL